MQAVNSRTFIYTSPYELHSDNIEEWRARHHGAQEKIEIKDLASYLGQKLGK